MQKSLCSWRGGSPTLNAFPEESLEPMAKRISTSTTLAAGASTQDAPSPTALKPGDAAPDFDLPMAGGGRIRLSDLKGRLVVLYFYPKDDTPGCTQQAISFSEKADDFAAIGATVIGVSRDSADKHERFKRKHSLNLVLASDEDGSACMAYGVWVEKALYGKRFMGIERSTFIITKEGRLALAARKVKVAGHVDAILAKAKAIAES
jgi:peroxiredoxin Q/BCP